jgi:ribosomal protein S13
MISRENTSDTSNRVVKNIPSNKSAIKSSINASNTVTGATSEATEPTYRGIKLLSVSKLFEAIFEKPSFGKRTRSEYYNIVHAFRAAFPSSKAKSGNLSTSDHQACSSAIQRMNSPEMSKLIAPPLLKKIERLSTPDAYEHIRRANRLRVHGQESLSEDGLKRLSREIRAAMIWRQLNGAS